MQLSKPAANGASSKHPRRQMASPGAPPDLWLQLPVEIRRQLAQQIGCLVQRLLVQSTQKAGALEAGGAPIPNRDVTKPPPPFAHRPLGGASDSTAGIGAGKKEGHSAEFDVVDR